MKRTPVTSSLLKSVGWNDDVLEVEFTTGHVYRYTGVTRATYGALMAAESVGNFYNRHIKGHFESWRLVEPAPVVKSEHEEVAVAR